MKNYRVKEMVMANGEKAWCGNEDQEQQKVIEWAMYRSLEYPELRLLHHVPNGGSRNRAEAVKLKRMGVKAGVPDLVLPSPHGGYAGLYIELKIGKNKQTDSQKEWMEMLTEQGYKVVLCYGGDAAIQTIENYIKSCKTLMYKEVKGKTVDEYLKEQKEF